MGIPITDRMSSRRRVSRFGHRTFVITIVVKTDIDVCPQVQGGSCGQEPTRAHHFGQGPLRRYRIRVSIKIRQHGQVEQGTARQILPGVLCGRRGIRHSR